MLMATEKFNWNDKFSVGIELIDKQHKEFFSIANTAIDFSNQAELEKKEVKSIFERLQYYTFYHFSTEEELFYKYNYPRTKEHIAEHKYFQFRMGRRDLGEAVHAYRLLRYR